MYGYPGVIASTAMRLLLVVRCVNDCLAPTALAQHLSVPECSSELCRKLCLKVCRPCLLTGRWPAENLRDSVSWKGLTYETVMNRNTHAVNRYLLQGV